MKYTDFTTHVRYSTKTDSTTFTDAEIVRLANMFKDEFAEAIEQRNEGYFTMEMYADLAANQRSYALPDEFMNRIVFLSVKLDGTNWVQARQDDLNQYGYTLDETTIQNQFSDDTPSFLILRKCIMLLTGSAIDDVTQGLHLFTKVYPATWNTSDLALDQDIAVDPTDDTLGFPRQFHELLARRVSIAYKQAREKQIPLTEQEQLFKVDFERALDNISEINTNRSYTAVLPYNDGSNY